MARNGSGTYSIPNTFTTGTTASSSAVNANFTDIGSEITGSLPRDGQAGMTGQLKSASGTAAAPGVTFSSDLDCGLYRIGADNLGVAVGGVKVLDIASTGLTVNDVLLPFPTGTAMLFAQTAAPTGWTKSTTHNDKALRVVSGTASSGGTTAFTSVMAARTIAQANLPNVTIALTGTTSSDGAHTHTVAVTPGSVGSATTGGSNRQASTSNSTTSSDGAHTHTVTGTTSSINGGVTQTTMDFAVQYVDVIIATKD